MSWFSSTNVSLLYKVYIDITDSDPALFAGDFDAGGGPICVVCGRKTR